MYSRVTQLDKKRLFDKDDRDYFVKLNERIDEAKRLRETAFENPDITELTDKIRQKVIQREKNKQFMNDNYKKGT